MLKLTLVLGVLLGLFGVGVTHPLWGLSLLVVGSGLAVWSLYRLWECPAAENET